MQLPERLSFDKELYTLLLAIDPESLSIPKYVSERAITEGFEAKKENHITIFGFGVGQKIAQALVNYPERLNELETLINGADWSLDFKQEFYALKRFYKIKGVDEERETIIMMVDVPGYKDFVDKVNKLLGLSLEYVPLHTTLYSKSSLEESMQAGVGISSVDDFKKYNTGQIVPPQNTDIVYKGIALPTRPQPDTIIAIFILKHFGEEKFNGVSTAEYVLLPRIPEGQTEESLNAEGVFLFDIGGGVFDHHNKAVQTTASSLIAEYLGVKTNPALSKLLQYAERDDFYGKGTISTDPLDRAFGLSGLIGSLNKKYVKDSTPVIDIVLPLIEAFYAEEEKRAFEMPKELNEKLQSGKAETFNVRQRGKNLKCILIETDNTSMAGFLRSKLGGGFDVVAIRLPSGHTNILTRPMQKVDLRSLAVLIRIQETEAQGIVLDGDPETFSHTGTLKEAPEWYYDGATNSILNGGPNPQGIKATSIDPFELRKILELGLSEQLWKPAY
ncbi:MAG: hypothetical protein WAZ50_02425 [Minisyncoccia bacterium]